MDTYKNDRGQWTPPKPPDPAKVGKLLGVIGIVLLLLVGVFTAQYTVAPEEEAVVLRLGRYIETTPPGLHFKLPFGVDRAINVPTSEVRKLEFGYRTVRADVRSVYAGATDSEIAQMLTGDLNIAHVEWVVQYRIDDPRLWLFSVYNQEAAIRDLSESVMRAAVGDYSVTEVLTEKRDEIKSLAKRELQAAVKGYELGVRIETVELQNVNPPEPVRDSFNEVNSAQQEKSRLENEAMREYNRVIPRARGEAEQAIEAARGYAADRVNRADGDVARFTELLAAYEESPRVTRQRMYLELIEKVLPRVKRIVVADESGVLKLLPLDPGGAGGGR